METVLVVLILGLLAASNPIAHLQQTYGYGTPTYRNQSRVEQTPNSVVAAFDAALNGHDVNAALDLFATDGFVHDAARETYSNAHLSPTIYYLAPTCFPSQLVAACTYSGRDKIQGWLQQLVAENIQVQEVGGFQLSGNNVTWNLAVSIDEYRSLAIAPLIETGQATLQGGKIQSLTLSLAPDSAYKLEAVVVKSNQSYITFQGTGFSLAIAILGLAFPLGSIYYISRVKSLFAAIPRLERPWLLLEVGVAALFLDVILSMFGTLLGIPPGIADTVSKAVLVALAAIFMVGMVLMKQAWTIPSSE